MDHVMKNASCYTLILSGKGNCANIIVPYNLLHEIIFFSFVVKSSPPKITCYLSMPQISKTKHNLVHTSYYPLSPFIQLHTQKKKVHSPSVFPHSKNIVSLFLHHLPLKKPHSSLWRSSPKKTFWSAPAPKIVLLPIKKWR